MLSVEIINEVMKDPIVRKSVEEHGAVVTGVKVKAEKGRNDQKIQATGRWKQLEIGLTPPSQQT